MKRIDYEDLIKTGRTLRYRTIFHIELGAVFVDLTETVFVLGNGNKAKLIAVAKLHSSQQVESGRSPQFDKVQRTGTIIDIGQHSSVIPSRQHSRNEILQTEGAISKAKVAM
ncbi:hypothetical protein L1283_005738 [Sphingobacterium sp. HSC-15S19]